MKVGYVSACFDNSGYAEAARNNIAALQSVGVTPEVIPLTFESFRSDLGRLGTICNNLKVQDVKSDIQIIHATPNVYPKYMRRDKYNIACTTWEASTLPGSWVPLINQMDEVWVPCTQNVEIFKNSGVTKPIHLIPHAFNRSLIEEEMKEKMPLQNIDSDEYVFYSIFQWTERKNPVALLKAYLTEFKKDEKVCLVIKTYLMNPNNDQEKERIKQAILEIKNKLYLKEYPKILLITSLLSRQEIFQLHKEGDCYLSFHRNEGFGIPIVEAMMAANPVICTGYGGPDDFVIQDSSTGFPVSYQLTPCYGMPWETYNGHMTWADINIMEARKHMRQVFENRKMSEEIGLEGQKFIDENFSWQTVGNTMKARLEAIQAKISGEVL